MSTIYKQGKYYGGGASDISSLEGVEISGSQSGQVLGYSSADGAWKNMNISSVLPLGTGLKYENGNLCLDYHEEVNESGGTTVTIG